MKGYVLVVFGVACAAAGAGLASLYFARRLSRAAETLRRLCDERVARARIQTLARSWKPLKRAAEPGPW